LQRREHGCDRKHRREETRSPQRQGAEPFQSQSDSDLQPIAPPRAATRYGKPRAGRQSGVLTLRPPCQKPAFSTYGSRDTQRGGGDASIMNLYVPASEAPARNSGAIKLHGEEGFAGMRRAGRIAAECLDALTGLVAPGRTTREIDEFVFAFGAERGALPATLNYRGYTKSCCTSLNHVVCHGIPDDKPLRDGDILNVDVTFVVEGWHGDSSRMYVAGTPRRAAERLIEVTWRSMMAGIEAVRPGATTGDIGAAIQAVAERERCSVVRDFCGHGVGRLFHDAPNILHYGRRGEGIELRSGMIFTIEPMINLGRPGVKVLSDGWTAVTRDRSLSAQFEHTVGVTPAGCEIFTLSPKGYTFPPYL
jgi:methionyl aminopeptidase